MFYPASHPHKSSHKSSRRAFTLTEILVALAVTGLLGALLFPVFGRAREGARQNQCAANLHSIYVASRQYREDFVGYPPTLEVLLPAGSRVVTTSGDAITNRPDMPGESSTDKVIVNGIFASPSMPALDDVQTVEVKDSSLAYLKSKAEVLCPSDSVELNGFTSSYGNKLVSVWNFYGYNRAGFQDAFGGDAKLLVDPTRPYDPARNPAKWSLANRFAPAGTVVTHCIFHRPASSQLRNPYALGESSDRGAGAGARDIVLRLDGSAKARDVSNWRTVAPGGQSSSWQMQTF